MLCDIRQLESEVRVCGGDVLLSTGKGKGTGTVGDRSGGRSEIGGLGVGGISGVGVGGISGTEVDGSGGRRVDESGGRRVEGCGVGGSAGTFGGQLCMPEVGGTNSFQLVCH